MNDRTWESCTLAFPCAVNRVIHDSIAFQKVDDAPCAEVGAQSNNQNFQGINRTQNEIFFFSIKSSKSALKFFAIHPIRWKRKPPCKHITSDFLASQAVFCYHTYLRKRQTAAYGGWP